MTPGLVSKFQCRENIGLADYLEIIHSTEKFPGRPIKKWRRQLRYLLGVSLNREVYDQWYRLLTTEWLQPYLDLNPALPMKPIRPYLAADMRPADRVRIIHDSLAYISARPELKALSQKGPGIPLARLALEQHGEFTLRAEFNLQEEGELSLALYSPEDLRIGITSFSLEKNADGAHTLKIGRVQGCSKANILSDLDKALCGMRLGAFLFFTVQEWAHAQGITRIFGVADRNHVLTTKQLIALPWVSQIGFSYDDFWAELGGRVGARGWFRLPPRLVRRTPEAVKRNKRSMYKKRYALLAEIALQIHQSVLCDCTA